MSDCDELLEIAVTGRKTTSARSITNNQEADVDEGDIVKLYDRFVIVLQHGRLFSIDIGGAQGSLSLVDRINAYDKPDDDAWYDEILIAGDTLLVTGYSYEQGQSIISLFRIGKDGRFELRSRHFLQTDDYFSWDNYATRIVDGRLVIYTPIDLTKFDVDDRINVPTLRSWTRDTGESVPRPLLRASDIYRPILPTLHPMVHAVSVCPLKGAEALKCVTHGFVAPPRHEMYVSSRDIYLWATREPWDWFEFPSARPCVPSRSNEGVVPAALFRISVKKHDVSATLARGYPFNQFAFDQKGDDLHALLVRQNDTCEESTDDLLQLEFARISDGDFESNIRRAPSRRFVSVPPVSDSGMDMRYAGSYLVYGGQQGRWRMIWNPRKESYERGELVIVDTMVPSQQQKIAMPHSTERIEVFGSNIVVFGYEGTSTLGTSILDLRSRPRLTNTLRLDGVLEAEGRSHAFNSIDRVDGSGMFGLPLIRKPEGDRWWDENSIHVHFFLADAGLGLQSAGAIAPQSGTDDKDYVCEVSCVDWYGNARPIFIGNRIFALVGRELIEGMMSRGQVAEVTRANLSSLPLHSRR